MNSKQREIYREQKIQFLINKMGLTDVEIKDAGSGMHFRSTKTRYKLVFVHNGERLRIGLNSDTSSSKFYALQFKATKMFGGQPCAKEEVVSAFMRTITANCSKCGGYGQLPTFEYPVYEKPKRKKQ